MNRARFLKMVQHRAARVAITASATRGQGKGVVRCARPFLVGLKLSPFGTADPRAFARQLDAATERLRSCLPKRAASWGLARKLLNIFLRDCFYTGYLARALDSITAKAIRKEADALPRWRGVRYLEPGTSAAYQEAARGIAKRHGFARVHLDAYWWGVRE